MYYREYYEAHKSEYAQRSAQWHREHRELVAERRKQWRQNNRERHRLVRKAWRQRNPLSVKASSRKSSLRKHNLTPEEYSHLEMKQSGLCAICGRDPRLYYKGRNSKLHVDHSHATGKNRGLLCVRCNNSVERIDTIPEWAAKALQYLGEYE